MKKENKNKKNKSISFLLALFTVLFCGAAFLSTIKHVSAAITPEQQASDEYLKKNGFSGVSTGNTTNGDTVLNNDTRLHSYPTPAPLSTPAPAPTSKKFNYILLESFPGFFAAGSTLTDLPKLILSIYKFGIWTVGIAGLFMLVVGGFMYMASAGNTSTAGNARSIIWDSLIGIVAALGAYLILYVINPDLTRINLNFTPVNVSESIMGTPMGPAGVCVPATTSECSVAALTPAFGAKATEASSICNGESNGNSVPSTADICADNSVASWGLFQINITVHPVGGLPCPKAFTSQYTAKDHSCRVKSDAYSAKLYADCAVAAKNASNNIAAAKSVYFGDKSSWRQWGANKRSNCNFH